MKVVQNHGEVQSHTDNQDCWFPNLLTCPSIVVMLDRLSLRHISLPHRIALDKIFSLFFLLNYLLFDFSLIHLSERCILHSFRVKYRHHCVDKSLLFQNLH
nr:MAG TPA: hypothetical protein [Caudoviricetes sp.]